VTVGGQRLLCFSEEFIDGPDLSKHLGESGLMGASEVVRLGLDVADAIESLWSLNRVHRDIKPQNMAPQQKLWVRLGSGRRPRLCIKANFATFAVRKPYDFLVTSFTLLLRPSTAPDETSPLARNQFRINGR
jgi:serine/threonine protein kinase